MTLITRPADVFEPGDRVYDTKTNQVLIANYHFFGNDTILYVVSDDATFIRLADYRNRFLRVIEPGETIPKGAVTSAVLSSGLGLISGESHDFTLGNFDVLRVLMSLPETDEELEATGSTLPATSAASFSDQSGLSDSKKTGECIHGDKCPACRQKAHRAGHADDVPDEALSLMQEDWGVMPVDETTQNDVSQPEESLITKLDSHWLNLYNEARVELAEAYKQIESLQARVANLKSFGYSESVCNHSVSPDVILQAAATIYANGMIELERKDCALNPMHYCVSNARELAAEISKQNKDTK